MKRHLNTSYRLVWNHITGTLVVASEPFVGTGFFIHPL
nr:ESPR-type extended signal peptide-containing protein [Escherichia coli]